MKRLMGYLKQNIWLVILGPFFKMVEAILELFNPIFVAKIIDNVITAPDKYYIIKFSALIVAFNVIGFICAIIGQKCASLTTARVGTNMRRDAFAQITSYSHAELDKFGTASILNRLTNDINQIEGAISMCMRTLMRTPFLLVGAFVLSLMINVKMSLIFLVLIPVVVIILWLYMKKTRPYFHVIRKKLDNISRVTRENLSGTRVIRSFNKQEFETKRFEETSNDFTDTSIKVAKISALLNPVIYLIVDVAVVALLLLGGWQINIGGMSQGDIIALIDYVAIITVSLLTISHIIVAFVRTSASLHRLDEIMDTKSSISDASNVKKYNKLDYDAILEFNNVSFNYTGDIKDKSFIKDLSFKIYPGQTIGIIGGTGSGKTTIANLMTRFYDATQGEILYKGKNIKEFSLEQLRHEISIVQQRSTLYSGTLRDNMRLRNPNVSDQEIIEALKIGQAWSFVEEWSNGLDYKIMAGGKNVSGGQMQRLTIARALIDKPEVLILDDSSSALDFMTDSKLRKGIKSLNTTTILISQRATSIQNADLIIVLDHGDVVGMGKHASLMKECDIYREIYESQSK